MKLKTIEQYVKCTDIPYPEIIERAIKSGWEIVHKDKKFTDDKQEYISIRIKNPDAYEIFETAYLSNEDTCALYNIYIP